MSKMNLCEGSTQVAASAIVNINKENVMFSAGNKFSYPVAEMSENVILNLFNETTTNSWCFQFLYNDKVVALVAFSKGGSTYSVSMFSTDGETIFKYTTDYKRMCPALIKDVIDNIPLFIDEIIDYIDVMVNGNIYNQAAKEIADAYADAYGEFDGDVEMADYYQEGDMEHMDDVVADIATIGEDVDINYNYIWATAYEMFQAMVADATEAADAADVVATPAEGTIVEGDVCLTLPEMDWDFVNACDSNDKIFWTEKYDPGCYFKNTLGEAVVARYNAFKGCCTLDELNTLADDGNYRLMPLCACTKETYCELGHYDDGFGDFIRSMADIEALNATEEAINKVAIAMAESMLPDILGEDDIALISPDYTDDEIEWMDEVMNELGYSGLDYDKIWERYDYWYNEMIAEMREDGDINEVA